MAMALVGVAAIDGPTVAQVVRRVPSGPVFLVCGVGLPFKETTVTIAEGGVVTVSTRAFEGNTGPTEVARDPEALARLNSLLSEAGFEGLTAEPGEADRWCRLGRTSFGRTFEFELLIGGLPPPRNVKLVAEELDTLAGGGILPPW